MRISVLVGNFVFASIMLAACAPGTPGNLGSAVAPSRPTLSPGKCETKKEARPLIVEKDSAERARLESLAKSGAVAVKYAGCEMEVLPQCKVPSTYRWVGVSTKRERVTMRNNDDLYASLPFGALKLEGALRARGELNVDMTVAGRYEVARGDIREDELEGDCAGATHFISGLTAGAFRFYSGANGSVAANGEAFGARAGGSSQASNDLLNEDGDASKCSGADPAVPPSGCAAIMRVELVDLKPGVLCPPRTKWNGKACAVVTKCARGYIASYGGCVPLGMHYDTLHPACIGGEDAACNAECERGDQEACAEMATRVGSKDPARTIALSRRACDSGVMRACLNLALGYQHGQWKLPVDASLAASLFERACDKGLAHGCNGLAELAYTGEGIPKDSARAAKLAERGCEGGSAFACKLRGNIAIGEKDVASARTYWGRACEAGHPMACANLGEILVSSDYGVNDDAAAVPYFRAGCNLGEPSSCGAVAAVYAYGRGVPKDEARAVTYGKQACNAGAQNGCYWLARFALEGIGAPRDTEAGMKLLRKSCDAGWKRSCDEIRETASSSESKPSAKASRATK